MELNEIIHPGMEREETFVVEEKHTATHMGSGSARVLATPWMIGLMEGVAHRLLAKHLPEEYSSVGVLVNIRHLAPTAVGSQIWVKAVVETIEGNTVMFHVLTRDSKELVGQGQHQRAVIEIERFLRRVAAKSSAS